jgi:hypothetical protein
MIARGKLGNIRLGTAIASSSRILGAPGELIVKDTRAAAARGRSSLNRGRWGASGRGLRRGCSTCS